MTILYIEQSIIVLNYFRRTAEDDECKLIALVFNLQAISCFQLARDAAKCLREVFGNKLEF